MSKKGFTLLPRALKDGFLKLIELPVNLFIRLNLHPNLFTILSLLVSILGGYFYMFGNIKAGGGAILIGGMFDTFDGKLARATGRSSKFGAVFDSSLDRYAELAMFFGMEIYFLNSGDLMTSIVIFFALSGSVMVSYVRARAEGLGMECKVGVMQRADRIVLVGVSCFIHIYALIVVLWIIAILANITAVQRMYHVWITEQNELAEQKTQQS